MTTEAPRQPIADLPSSPLSWVANLLVKEAIRNEALGDKNHKAELIRGLTRQTPNRIYAGNNGSIARVLMFSDRETSYQAYMETLNKEAGMWRRTKSQFLAGVSPKALEQEIIMWRREFGLYLDLLENPYAVFEVTGRRGQVSEEYLHVAKTRDSAVSVHYFLGTVRQPYIIGIHIGTTLPYKDGNFYPLTKPPEEVLTYAHPFGIIKQQQ